MDTPALSLEQMLADRSAKVTLGTLADIVLHLAGGRNTFPVILTSDGLVQRTFPYASPIEHSFQDGWAAFNRVAQYNPMDEAITGSVTGPGTITLGLPGAPGPATSADKSAFFPGVLIDVAKSANIAPAPVTLNMAGFFEDGSAYAMPGTEFGWAPGASDIEHILVLVAEETQRGPRLRTGQLTTNDYPAQFFGNGAPAMVAGRQLLVNVTAAPAGCVVNAAVINSQHYAYDVLRALWSERVLPGAPAIRSGARISEVVSPARAPALRATALSRFMRK